jgi:hypothetical protein
VFIAVTIDECNHSCTHRSAARAYMQACSSCASTTHAAAVHALDLVLLYDDNSIEPLHVLTVWVALYCAGALACKADCIY